MYFPASDDDKKTLEEIGQELGMTKMGVKKLVDRAVNKLKGFAREMGFKNGSTPLK
jgi:DNA-directed RNA polymerase sigma subunit (sigma70/sigma32)